MTKGRWRVGLKRPLSLRIALLLILFLIGSLSPGLQLDSVALIKGPFSNYTGCGYLYDTVLVTGFEEAQPAAWAHGWRANWTEKSRLGHQEMREPASRATFKMSVDNLGSL